MSTEERFKDAVEKLPREIAAVAAFLTRLPVERWLPAEGLPADFTTASRSFPLIGAAIGLAGGIVLALAAWVGLPPLICGALAVGAGIALTGGLHEDGLADTADGMGGGANAAERLDIMRDSRIGTFGAAALALGLIIRVAALAALVTVSPFAALLALVAAECASRAAMVRLWHDLPAARMEGLSSSGGQPSVEAAITVLAIAGAIGFLLIVPGYGLWAFLWTLAAAIGVTLGFGALCRAAIGGQTGDTLGATQQVVLAAMLATLSIFA